MQEIEIAPDFHLLVLEKGEGRDVLVLHGGGGFLGAKPIIDRMARSGRVIAPIHPGWEGTERPPRVAGIADLAVTYLNLLEAQRITDALVIGTSLGGWTAAEMAVRDKAKRIGGLVLIDAVGVAIEDEPITNFFDLDPHGIARNVFYDSTRYYVDPAELLPDDASRSAANVETMRILAGDPLMHDPSLLERLSDIKVPALVIWGEGDGIVTPAYGRAYAEAIPTAEFELIAEAGHQPHVEKPTETFARIDAFVAKALI